MQNWKLIQNYNINTEALLKLIQYCAFDVFLIFLMIHETNNIIRQIIIIKEIFAQLRWLQWVYVVCLPPYLIKALAKFLIRKKQHVSERNEEEYEDIGAWHVTPAEMQIFTMNYHHHHLIAYSGTEPSDTRYTKNQYGLCFTTQQAIRQINMLKVFTTYPNPVS